MKNFIRAFFGCLVICVILISLFADFIFNNIWMTIVFIALIFAVIITVYMNQESRIEELEKKVEQLSIHKQD